MSSVTHPKHYNSGKIEVIEAIEDWGLNFHRGNAVKYIARAGKKDPAKEIEDLEKAIWYAKREIERLSCKIEDRPSVKPNDMNPKQESDKKLNPCRIFLKDPLTFDPKEYIFNFVREIEGVDKIHKGDDAELVIMVPMKAARIISNELQIKLGYRP